MFLLLPLFSLSLALKNIMSLQKLKKEVWSFVNFIKYVFHSFYYVKFNLFISQFHLLVFDFYIKFGPYFFIFFLYFSWFFFHFHPSKFNFFFLFLIIFCFFLVLLFINWLIGNLASRFYWVCLLWFNPTSWLVSWV